MNRFFKTSLAAVGVALATAWLPASATAAPDLAGVQPAYYFGFGYGGYGGYGYRRYYGGYGYRYRPYYYRGYGYHRRYYRPYYGRRYYRRGYYGGYRYRHYYGFDRR